MLFVFFRICVFYVDIMIFTAHGDDGSIVSAVFLFLCQHDKS